ncbi:cadherin repeat domain-containing protein [Bradyrhizobium sp. RD5-C2]|uniref:cadherin repeat domain-containing protein n=1 Tax=Bradyrhizobium sp. RD5-C2 TaxID=244562 RepID=UPI001CC3B5B4|nr:cadherin repeat domain-containing protein [Bradyrhizobium sp. RD5-C2]GIQ77493.1 hypothetical protein BraRD5C2_59420 [Bradyrhizobium sp. RD5-C2]
MSTIPAYTIGGLTRPELQLDSTGHIVLDAAAQAFADTYGLQYLYLGCPPGTLWPPVTDSLSAPVDANSGSNTVIEGAAANTLANITAQATSSSGNAVTYSLTGDTSSGGFKIDPNTGVVSVADPTKINYVTSPGHAYTITVQASDGIATSAQSFSIAVTDVAPSTPVDSNAAANKVAEGAAAGTAVGITATSADMNAVTYSLTGDSSGGGFAINATTGVITVADPSKINYVTAPGHAYTVTATASDGTLSSSQSFTIDVTLGAATHFAVSIPANGAAGTPGTVTVTSLDALNHVVTNYTGTVHFTSSDGQAALPADVTLTNGTGSFSETLDTAGSQTITATDTANSAVKGTSNAEIVTPGVATHFSVSLPANGTAGTPGSVIVTALDAFNNVATSYSGIVHFTSSDGSAVLPADMTLTNGTGSFNETFKTAGSQTVTATDTVSAINGTSNTETVTGGVATHFVVSIPASGAAGTPGSVIVTALDAFGNVATGYTGTVHFTSSDGHAVLPADVTLTNGTGSFSETFESIGSQTIIATDTVSPGITGTSNTETVTPGPVTHFAISIPGSSTAGVAGSGTVTALDAFGNVVTGYTGTVHFTSTDGHAVLPANMTLTNGTATFSETLDTAGSQTITATDTVTSTITGTSNAETVTAAAATHFAVSIPGSGSAGTAGSGTVSALDPFGNVVTGYSGTVHFTSTDGSAALPADMVLTNGTGTFNETFDTAGNQTITATDTISAITGTSNAENVAPGPATHFVVSIPANGRADIAGSVTVTALDAHGNVATGYTGTVHFTSSDPTAVLPSDTTLTGGIGTFTEKFETAGSQTITATDTVSAGVTGTSNAETVAPPDAPPVVTGGHTLNYIEGQAATAFDPALTVTDADNATLDHVTVQITGNYFNGQDVLGFVDTAHIHGAWDALHGELTLTGIAGSTVGDFQTALDSITYFNTSNNPSGLARTVTITANDGTLDGTPATDTIDVTPVNNPPVVTIGAITNFSEPPVGTPPANSIPVTIAPNLTITDVDSANLISATFELSDLKPSDVLSIAGHAGTSGDIGNIHFAISSTATTETVTLTGTDTIAHYNAILDAVQFNNTGEPPDTTARAYTVTAVDDGGTAHGGNDTGSASATQTVTAINDPPTATVPSDSSVGTAFSHTNLAISGLSVADIDSAGGNETATITSNHGALSFDVTGLASFTNNNTHTVTLTGTIAQVNTALATLTYNSDDGFTGTDTVTLNVNDNGNTGTPGAQTSGPQTFHVGVVPQVFYIDNSTTGTSHNLGTQADPYTSIAAFNAANPAGSGDYVVLEHGTGTYSEANGINLANGVNLIGGSHTLQFTNPVTNQLVTANVGSGTDPVIHVTGADNGIDLLGTTGHTINGVSIDTSASTGIGISDDGNNVGTVTMSDIVIKTASGAGMNFTHGGSITLTGTANSITSGTGTALDVENTQIGSNNLTFKSITSSGGSGNGIILSNTGTAAGNGGLHVTGDGSTAGSGGTIASKTGVDGSTTQGSGVYLNNTKDVQISFVTMHDFQNYGIVGTNVTGFALGNTTVTGTNGTSVGGIGEGDVYFTGLSGTASITNSTLTGAAYDALHVFNDGGQTLNRITVTGSTFATNSAAGNASNDAIGFEATGGTFNATIQNSNVTSARGDMFQLNLLGTVSSDLVMSGDNFSNTNQNIVSGGGGITIGGGGPTNNITLTYDIANNIIKGALGAALAVTKGTGTDAHFTGTIDGNTIGTQGVAGSGSTQGIGINVFQDGAGTSSTTITNNHISGVVGGIFTLNHNGAGGAMTAVIQGNTIDTLDSTNGFAGIDVQNGSATGAGGDNNLLNATIGGAGALKNSVDLGGNTGLGLVAGIFLEQEGVSKTGLIGSPNYAGTPYNFAAVGSYVAGNNTVTGTGNGAVGTQAIGDPGQSAGGGYFGGAQFMVAVSGGVEAASPTTGETNLTQTELNSVISAAIAQWATAGATASQLATMKAVTFSVASLGGNVISAESIGHITIDASAAGHGWFVDPTPSDNFEFAHAATATDLFADPTSAAAGHLDLLTAVAHELGHVVGLADDTTPSHSGDLMYINLADGERRLPSAADANTAAPHVMPTQGTASSQFNLATGDSFNFSSFTQSPPQTPTGASHADTGANTQNLSDLFSGLSNAAAPWWTGHEAAFAAMGGTPTDNHAHTQVHHDLIV